MTAILPRIIRYTIASSIWSTAALLTLLYVHGGKYAAALGTAFIALGGLLWAYSLIKQTVDDPPTLTHEYR